MMTFSEIKGNVTNFLDSMIIPTIKWNVTSNLEASASPTEGGMKCRVYDKKTKQFWPVSVTNGETVFDRCVWKGKKDDSRYRLFCDDNKNATLVVINTTKKLIYVLNWRGKFNDEVLKTRTPRLQITNDDPKILWEDRIKPRKYAFDKNANNDISQDRTKVMKTAGIAFSGLYFASQYVVLPVMQLAVNHPVISGTLAAGAGTIWVIEKYHPEYKIKDKVSILMQSAKQYKIKDKVSTLMQSAKQKLVPLISKPRLALEIGGAYLAYEYVVKPAVKNVFNQ